MTTLRSKLYLRPINVPHPTEETIDFSKLATPIKDVMPAKPKLVEHRIYAIFNVRNADVTNLDHAESIFRNYKAALNHVVDLNACYANSGLLFEIYPFIEYSDT